MHEVVYQYPNGSNQRVLLKNNPIQEQRNLSMVFIAVLLMAGCNEFMELPLRIDPEAAKPDGTPSQVSLGQVTNTSNPQFARVVVNWEVSGENLSEVSLSTTGPNIDSGTCNVSGNSASGQHKFSFRRGHGTYNVTLTVTNACGDLSKTKGITL